jgi:type IV secretion system protein VirB4
MGWVFDNPSETLAWEKQQILGFDVTEFLDHPEIRTPLMMYLFHRIEAMFDGTPIQIFMDEFWKLLQDDAFEQFAQNKQKVIRKQNGIMIYGTQSAKDILQSKIAHALVEQCATFIFLPNPKAQKEEYQTGFHLSDREFELIHSEMPTRHFLLKQGNQSVVAKLDLQGFEQELTIISGTTQMVLLLDQIRHEYGDMPEDWMPIFQKKSQELLCKKSS